MLAGLANLISLAVALFLPNTSFSIKILFSISNLSYESEM